MSTTDAAETPPPAVRTARETVAGPAFIAWTALALMTVSSVASLFLLSRQRERFAASLAAKREAKAQQVAEMLDHVAAYVVADPVDVPVGDALSDQRSPLVSDPSRLLAPHTHGRIGGHKQASMVVAVRVCS